MSRSCAPDIARNLSGPAEGGGRTCQRPQNEFACSLVMADAIVRFGAATRTFPEWAKTGMINVRRTADDGALAAKIGSMRCMAASNSPADKEYELRDGIEIHPPPGRPPYRFGFVKAGNANDLHAGNLIELGEGGAQIGGAIAEVRAERDVNACYHFMAFMRAAASAMRATPTVTAEAAHISRRAARSPCRECKRRPIRRAGVRWCPWP